jgi:hypothetical protein
MAEPRLIIKKRPRGEYEIGTYNEDGSIVAHVSVRDDEASGPRTEDEKERAALTQATRLVAALERILSGA